MRGSTFKVQKAPSTSHLDIAHRKFWLSGAGNGAQGAPASTAIMRPDGSDVRRLTDDAFEEATPAFAPSRTATR